MPPTAAPAAEASKAPSEQFSPVDWSSYEEEKAARAAERAKKRRDLIRALDPHEAATMEAAKPRYTYEVSCTYHRPNRKGHLEEHSRKETVRAQNESEAWALFCDKVGVWPSRQASEVKIKQKAA